MDNLQVSSLFSHAPSATKSRGVIIMDTCPITALGMRRVLIESCGIDEEIIHLSRLAEIIQHMKDREPEILVMDLCGEKESVLDGLRLLSRIRALWPEVRVVICTAFRDYRILQLVASSGVQGILLKNEPTIALAQCVSLVIMGREFYSPKIRQLLQTGVTDPGHKQEGTSLTTRELDVLTYLFSGMSVTSVAVTMHRDIRTISTHKRNAMAKLGFQNDSELFAQGTWMAKTGPHAAM